MSERRRQFLLGYRDTLLVAYGITVLMMPAFTLSPISPLRTPASLALLFVVSGFLFGTGFFLVSVVRQRIRLRSFLLNTLVQTLLMALTVIVATLLDVWTTISVMVGQGPFHPNVLKNLGTVVQPFTVGVTLVGGTFLAGLINAVFNIDRKLGPGIMWSWLTGKYYNPKEEERIFMFLDMKDSTSIAEHLGSLKFSALVRDFFQDLTYPVLESRGEVSHYIGDEVVLTWKTAEGVKNANCIGVFFRMQKAIESRREFYSSTYGLVPEFKAGVHVGRVVATEVGEIKSEIVFHGDPLNTTARIQGLCNEEAQALLISGDLAQLLNANSEFELKPLGPRKLKGRIAEIELFAVYPPRPGA